MQETTYKEFIGVLHRKTDAGFKRLSMAFKVTFNYELDYDYKTQALRVVVNIDSELREQKKDLMRLWLERFENNRMKFN
ncbi:hypothetical protein [Paenibacillus elgii]|uniref:hypothetical protein n=1 Tax=Paenibacillus elgii TaxID=189691 RepID=UPI0020421B82|nr:hypothetical protein [Paenibacillus elgii]MCM3273055.1 hypothetical protein [Paenibacillus elgii]